MGFFTRKPERVEMAGKLNHREKYFLITALRSQGDISSFALADRLSSDIKNILSGSEVGLARTAVVNSLKKLEPVRFYSSNEEYYQALLKIKKLLE